MRRICITGTQGTGKTTLATALSSALGLALAPEAAREVAQTWQLASMDDLAPVDVGRFHAAILDRQLAWLAADAEFVTDRGVLDTAAHIAFLAPDEALFARARAAMSGYSHVLYLPPEFEPPDDGFRRRDPEWAARQDAAIRELLAEWSVPFTSVRGSVDERLLAALAVIGA